MTREMCIRDSAGAAFEDDGPQPCAGEDEGGEDAGGAEAGDDGPGSGRGGAGYLIALLRLGGLAPQADADGADPAYGPAPARVESAAGKDQLLDIFGADTEAFRGEGAQLSLVLAGGEAQVCELMHGVISCLFGGSGGAAL